MRSSFWQRGCLNARECLRVFGRVRKSNRGGSFQVCLFVDGTEQTSPTCLDTYRLGGTFSNGRAISQRTISSRGNEALHYSARLNTRN
jgi:hypothetical protein